MSDGISAPFIRYPIGTSLMMAGILFVGLVAYPLLPVAPLPQVDFPTIQVAATLPGGSPETMASSVAQPLERQLAQIPGIAQMTSTSYLGTAAVTIQFDLNRSHRRRRQRRAGRDQRRRRAIAEEPPLAADLSQGQSGGFADPAAVGDIGHAAADHRQRRRRCPARAADQPDLRRRPGHHRRPAEAGDPGPDRPGQARRQGPVAGGRAQPDRDHHRRQPEGQYRRRHPRLHHLRQRPVARIRRTGTTSSSPTATAARCGSAISARPSPARKTPSRRPGPTASAACSWWCSSSPAPTSSRPSTRSRRRCRGWSPRSRPRSRSRSSATAPRPSAPRSRTCSSRCC